MIRFAGLFAAIDRTNSTNAKVEAMVQYFATAPPHDAAWAVFFLTGRRLKRLVHGMAVGQWALTATGLSEWLLGESYAVVGDGAETAALILDQLPSLPSEDTLARRMDRGAHPAAAKPRSTRSTGAGDRLAAAPESLGALHAAEAAHRRAARGRVADTRRARAGADGGPAGDDDGGAADGRMDAGRSLVSSAADAGRDRRGPLAAVSVQPGDAARARGRRVRSDARAGLQPDRSRRRGSSSGNGTAFAHSSSNATARCISGRVERSSSPIDFPRSSSRPRHCPMASCSTARCSRSGTGGRCRSRRCSSGSDVRSRSPARRATCPSCS